MVNGNGNAQGWVRLMVQLVGMAVAIIAATSRLENRITKVEEKVVGVNQRIEDLSTAAERVHTQYELRLDRLEQKGMR